MHSAAYDVKGDTRIMIALRKTWQSTPRAPWCIGQSLPCVYALCWETVARAPQAADLRMLVPND